MRRAIFKALAMVATGSFAVTAFGADELSVYVFRDGNPATGLVVELDGDVEKTVGEDGSVFFDMDNGPHVLGVSDKGNVLETVRFSSAVGQLADVTLALQWGAPSRVSVETYFPNEAASERSKAPTGTLLGRVSKDGESLVGVEVRAEGTNYSATTDNFGNYRLTLPRGVYTLTLTDPDLGEQKVEDLRVVANIERGASFALSSPTRNEEVADTMLDIGSFQIEEVFAIAKYKPTDFGESERYSAGVVDTMGIEDLSRFGGTDITQSVIRVPSVTIQDGRFVFIRGLGGRYITTNLNGALLPSTDPNKRTIPLDLFPTNFVSQLDVNKSFIASMPGESTGGNLVINTRTYPTESEGRISVQTGYVQDLTGETVFSDPTRGSTDFLGFDDGARSNAATFRAISDVLDQSEFYPPAVEQELRRVGAILLADDLDLGTSTANPTMVLGANYGNAYDLDWNDAEVGFFAAVNYRNEWSQRIDGIQRTYSGRADTGTIETEDDFDFVEYFNNVEISGLLNLGLTVGNSTYGANTLLSRVTQERTKFLDGTDGDEQLPSIRHTIEWVERQFVSQQFTGNHVLGKSESLVADWQITGSLATRNAPDRRDVRFDLDGTDGIYNLEVPAVLRRYDELTDSNIDGRVDFDYTLPTPFESTLSFGGQSVYRERDSDSETFGFIGGLLLDDNAPNLRADDVLTFENITGNPSTGYAFQDKTLASDSYEADLTLNAAYVSYDVLPSESHQFIAGVRWEDFDQTTDTFSLQGSGQGEPVTANLDESVLLPSFAYNWFFTENQTLRFGVSKTVSRPDFKEFSNATFFDPEFDIRIRGNPNLEIADAINYDVRYQYFWDDVDSWSIGAFYKDLSDPIERVVQPASGTVGNTRTFQNAESAIVKGIEVEGRKEFALGGSLTKSLFLSANASLIDSEVELIGRNTNRALQGQPEYVVNLIVGYDDIDNNQELTLLLNQNGDTIVDVGVSGQPDIILEPRLDLQMNYRWSFADNWQFIFRGQNLLDTDVEFTQGGNIYQKYRTGREFTVGLNWNF